MSRREVETPPWRPVRPDLTSGVEGRLLIEAPARVVLTRVDPDGTFAPHRDAYGHHFHILAGRAKIMVGAEWLTLGPGESLRIAAGELHAYRNDGPAELLLISINLPLA